MVMPLPLGVDDDELPDVPPVEPEPLPLPLLLEPVPELVLPEPLELEPLVVPDVELPLLGVPVAAEEPEPELEPVLVDEPVELDVSDVLAPVLVPELVPVPLPVELELPEPELPGRSAPTPVLALPELPARVLPPDGFELLAGSGPLIAEPPVGALLTSVCFLTALTASVEPSVVAATGVEACVVYCAGSVGVATEYEAAAAALSAAAATTGATAMWLCAGWCGASAG
jgi:hypothetical protein